MLIDCSGAVGPNAILQTAGALRDMAGAAIERDVLCRAGLQGYLDNPPRSMVPQAEVACLFAALRQRLTQAEADGVLGQSGRRTAHYIIAHRIPRAAAGLISLMPVPIGARLLLTAIARHAWTFAGDGRVAISRGFAMRLDIGANPLATPGCPWHCATLTELFRQLVAPRICM